VKVAEFGLHTWQSSGRRFGKCENCGRLVVQLYEDSSVQHNVNGEATCPTGYAALAPIVF
jgi:hypothetical protein